MINRNTENNQEDGNGEDLTKTETNQGAEILWGTDDCPCDRLTTGECGAEDNYW